MKKWIIMSLILLISATAGAAVLDKSALAFGAQIEVGEVERLGVLDGGRVKLLDTFAREQLEELTGKDAWQGVSPTFAYLELYFNAGEYLDTPLIEVDKALRVLLVDALPRQAAEALRSEHRIAVRYLLEEQGAQLLRAGYRGVSSARLDVSVSKPARTKLMDADFDPALRRAHQRLEYRYSQFIAADSLRLIPPLWAGGPWAPVDELAFAAGESIRALPEGADEVVLRLHGRLERLGQAWRARDVDGTNMLLRELAADIRQINPQAQPSSARVRAELLYNRLFRFTVAWIAFAVAFVLMLAATVRGGRVWRRLGLATFGFGTLLLGLGFAIRWWLSDRAWYLPPVMNQFESVTGAALLGAITALVLEKISPKNVYALGASFFAAAGLLCGYMLPQAMGANIRATQGILNNWILPLHVGTIILGYAMIGMGVIISLLYLIVLARWRGGAARSSGADLTMIPAMDNRLAELDRSNLIVAQLACWLVGLGTIIGAYWADYSWGRWWGFDAKETWALITWIIYLGIIHVRFVTPSRWRGSWTAGLSLAGAAVMIFNWVIVKYLLPSLHGYA